MSSIKTACPLDCYDACEIVFTEDKITAKKEGHTQGFLCPHMNHFLEQNFIQKARYKGKEIELDEALTVLKKMLEESMPSRVLHYRGSGNFSLMQEVMDHFFASYGATLTNGSLCDGAGEAGILEGRGSNKNMSLSEIEKADVVVVWGRDPHTTSSHLLPMLESKKVIVIDPRVTPLAKKSDLHIQLKPRGDYVLAMLLSRFLVINEQFDVEYLEEFASEYEEFYELTQTIRIKASLEDIDVSLGEIGKFLELVEGKKVAFVVGVGVQKYADGAEIMRAIDAVALFLSLFGKEGSGVAYLGNSKEGIESPFYTDAKRVSKVDTLFSSYDTVFIQSANPLSQMPNTQRVERSMQKVKNLIYFGLYENETSEMADLVIPAKHFLAKDDIRVSYSHNAMIEMKQALELDYGISEYQLSRYLCESFDIDLQTQEAYIEHFKSFAKPLDDGSLEVKGREKTPYKDGFDTDDGEFCFLDEYENDFDMSNDFFLITPKSKKSLNSQFKREDEVYLHPSLGFEDSERLVISSLSGECELRVKNDESLREDCVMIYSGTKGVNNLTSSKHSYEGKSAIYQENKVKIKKKGNDE